MLVIEARCPFSFVQFSLVFLQLSLFLGHKKTFVLHFLTDFSIALLIHRKATVVLLKWWKKLRKKLEYILRWWMTGMIWEKSWFVVEWMNKWMRKWTETIGSDEYVEVQLRWNILNCGYLILCIFLNTVDSLTCLNIHKC